MLKLALRATIFGAAALVLAACQDGGGVNSARARAPVPAKTVALMQSKNMDVAAPIIVRSYKKESELEVWKRNRNGDYALLKTYPICRWSGQLGPKVREGDRQAPEGFYTITPAQMNPNSQFFLSFDTGFPNAYDKAHGRTGSYLMVHGACSSRGCFSMTDEQIAEIYAIGREAFAGGQRSFQFQSYPFRMTPENLARYRNDPHIAFWRNLKEGSDYFEVTKQPPVVGVCNKRYAFGSRAGGGASCPSPAQEPVIAEAIRQKNDADEAKVAGLVANGTRAVRLVHQDGGQHPSFRADNSSIMSFAGTQQTPRNVSRPEAVASGPTEVEMPDAGAPRTAVTAATPAGRPEGGEGVTAANAPTASFEQTASIRPAAPVAAEGEITSSIAAAAEGPAPAAAPRARGGLLDRAMSLVGMGGGQASGDRGAEQARAPGDAPAPSTANTGG